jgi:hypothetical protein
MSPGDLAVPAALVVDPPIIDSPIIDSSGGLDHHVANSLRIEPGAAQNRFHDLVIEQICEARLIEAAFSASGHGSLLTYEILRTIAAKRVRFVTTTRRFHGNSPIPPRQFELWRKPRPNSWGAG